MNGLDTVLPKSQLVERFGNELTLEEFGKSELNSIARIKPDGLHEIGASVWNRIVVRGWHSVEPTCLSDNFDNRDPNLYGAISRLLDIEVIRDIYYVRGWKGTKKRRQLVVELLLAWVYQNDLHLADITFIDPNQPIPRDKRLAFQTHKGLGLLPVLLANLQQKGKQLGCEQLTLIAATRDQMRLFAKHGFVVENSPLARLGMKTGIAIPMERTV